MGAEFDRKSIKATRDPKGSQMRKFTEAIQKKGRKILHKLKGTERRRWKANKKAVAIFKLSKLAREKLEEDSIFYKL